MNVQKKYLKICLSAIEISLRKKSTVLAAMHRERVRTGH
jgi:hypothetical protein